MPNFNWLTQGFNNFASAFGNGIQSATPYIQQGANAVWNGIQTAAPPTWNAIRTAAPYVGSGILGATRLAGNLVGGTARLADRLLLGSRGANYFNNLNVRAPNHPYFRMAGDILGGGARLAGSGLKAWAPYLAMGGLQQLASKDSRAEKARKFRANAMGDIPHALGTQIAGYLERNYPNSALAAMGAGAAVTTGTKFSQVFRRHIANGESAQQAFQAALTTTGVSPWQGAVNVLPGGKTAASFINNAGNAMMRRGGLPTMEDLQYAAQKVLQNPNAEQDIQDLLTKPINAETVANGQWGKQARERAAVAAAQAQKAQEDAAKQATEAREAQQTQAEVIAHNAAEARDAAQDVRNRQVRNAANAQDFAARQAQENADILQDEAQEAVLNRGERLATAARLNREEQRQRGRVDLSENMQRQFVAQEVATGNRRTRAEQDRIDAENARARAEENAEVQAEGERNANQQFEDEEERAERVDREQADYEEAERRARADEIAEVEAQRNENREQREADEADRADRVAQEQADYEAETAREQEEQVARRNATQAGQRDELNDEDVATRERLAQEERDRTERLRLDEGEYNRARTVANNLSQTQLRNAIDEERRRQTLSAERLRALQEEDAGRQAALQGQEAEAGRAMDEEVARAAEAANTHNAIPNIEGEAEEVPEVPRETNVDRMDEEQRMEYINDVVPDRTTEALYNMLEADYPDMREAPADEGTRTIALAYEYARNAGLLNEEGNIRDRRAMREALDYAENHPQTDRELRDIANNPEANPVSALKAQLELINRAASGKITDETGIMHDPFLRGALGQDTTAEDRLRSENYANQEARLYRAGRAAQARLRNSRKQGIEGAFKFLRDHPDASLDDPFMSYTEAADRAERADAEDQPMDREYSNGHIMDVMSKKAFREYRDRTQADLTHDLFRKGFWQQHPEMNELMSREKFQDLSASGKARFIENLTPDDVLARQPDDYEFTKDFGGGVTGTQTNVDMYTNSQGLKAHEKASGHGYHAPVYVGKYGNWLWQMNVSDKTAKDTMGLSRSDIEAWHKWSKYLDQTITTLVGAAIHNQERADNRFTGLKDAVKGSSNGGRLTARINPNALEDDNGYIDFQDAITGSVLHVPAMTLMEKLQRTSRWLPKRLRLWKDK
jgi:hypothetical protein